MGQHHERHRENPDAPVRNIVTYVPVPGKEAELLALVKKHLLGFLRGLLATQFQVLTFASGGGVWLEPRGGAGPTAYGVRIQAPGLTLPDLDTVVIQLGAADARVELRHLGLSGIGADRDHGLGLALVLGAQPHLERPRAAGAGADRARQPQRQRAVAGTRQGATAHEQPAARHQDPRPDLEQRELREARIRIRERRRRRRAGVGREHRGEHQDPCPEPPPLRRRTAAHIALRSTMT